MAFVVANRVQETSTTSGTGTLNLGGAATGYQTFVSGVGNGNSTYYVIQDPIANVWEVGLGTVTSGSPATLSRTTVFSNSSGTTSPLSLAGNTVNVWCDYPAEQAVVEDNLNTAYAQQLAASNGLVFNNATISASVSLPSGYNAVSAGPITIATGITVTVPSGSVWAVV